jgi:hypothetical protein
VADADAGPVRAPRRWRSRGGLVTIATVASLVTGMGLTVLGLGAADQAVASYDAASWVWSRVKGETARINGVTARIDTRVDVAPVRGHQMQVSQTDRFVIMRDLITGQVSSMDLTSLKLAATAPTTAGLGVTVALHDDAAFVVDTVQGIVQQIDPRTLSPIGDPLRFPPGITGGVFDGQGQLWIAVPGEGTVTAITAAALSSDAASGGTGGGLPGPQVAHTATVAPPSHDLTISTLDSGVAVLNRTTNALTTMRGDQRQVVDLALAGPGSLPAHTDGSAVPVTVSDDRQVYVVTDDGGVRDFTVPGTGSGLKAAVAWKGYYYVADESTGTVHVFDGNGTAAQSIGIEAHGGPLDLEVRENYLFINAPDSSTARVVDDKHGVRVVDKYADDVLGGDPPPVPPIPPKPPKPVVSRPSAPHNVTAAAGNSEARVSWRPAAANGAAITRYVVEGAGKTLQVGARQRSVQVTGLTNGETYRFTVHAVNAKGAGPSRTSNPVRPTAEVPDAPPSVTAEARPDGTVRVSWAKANGQGRKIRKYQVTAISDGSNSPIGEATGTELTIKGDLEYGKQYAFTVVAVNERGAGSKPSPVSQSVVPFTTPGKPGGVDASTVGGRKGAIRVAWALAADNGRPITKYVVKAAGRTAEVTGTEATMTGFGDGENVSVEVRAVNQAGQGQPGTATARTVAAPKVTVTGSSATATAATITFTVDAGGGTATCSVTGGGKTASGSCSSLTVKGLNPGTSFSFTVTAQNAAGGGTAKRTQATDALYGIATCRNGENGDTATYCDKERAGERNGNEIFEVTRQDDGRQAGWVPNKTRLKAYCKKSGESVYAYIYNGDKRSTWWVQVDYKGKNYIPWAWLNLEGGDDIDVLPTC